MNTTTDQVFKKNRQYKDKNLLFDDISPIGKCLDSCYICNWYYIFYNLESYSISECSCHKNLLTYQDSEPRILSIQRERQFDYIEREKYDLSRFPKDSIFGSIEEIFSKVSTRC